MKTENQPSDRPFLRLITEHRPTMKPDKRHLCSSSLCVCPLPLILLATTYELLLQAATWEIANSVHTGDKALQSSLAASLRPPLSSGPESSCFSDCIQTNPNESPNKAGTNMTQCEKMFWSFLVYWTLRQLFFSINSPDIGALLISASNSWHKTQQAPY